MTKQPIPRSTPEEQGISSAAILDFVTRAGQTIESLHSFMLLRHGVVVAEGWWSPYQPDAAHMLFSLSKSFTSTAVGLAVSEGLLTIEDPLIKFFPADAPGTISPNLGAMQIRHLLSMSTGHALDTTEHIMQSRNPFQAFLELPVEHVPGTHFVYNSGASYMLAAIIQKLTGQTLLEYLTPRLFEPLGIKTPVWDTHPNGVNFGGWGLNITTEDIARFGQLYLQKGAWHGRQLIPAGWVEAATAKQIANDDEGHPDWQQGYGYQFWRCRPAGSYRGDGAFGQFCVVLPEQDAVLAITSGCQEMQPILQLAWDCLLPHFHPSVLPANPPAADSLARVLANLSLPVPAGMAQSAEAARVSGKVFTFEANRDGLHSLSLDFDSKTLTYQLTGRTGKPIKHSLRFGLGKWVKGRSWLRTFVPRKVATSAAWTAGDTFTLSMYLVETPFTGTIELRFVGQQVHASFSNNVYFISPDGPTQLVGQAS
jgi:CubicO group peptidase (beta-lactamase class C family)